MKTLHPYLFAIFPIVYLYVTNTSEVSHSDIIIPIAISLGVVVFLLWILGRATKNVIKSALTVSALLPFFYFYSQFTTKGLLPLWIALLAMCIILIWKTHRNLTRLNKYMSIISIMLVAISLANLAIYEVNKAKAVNETVPIDIIVSPENPRDIYYIIL